MGIPNFNPEVIKKEARLGDDVDFGKFKKLMQDLYKSVKFICRMKSIRVLLKMFPALDSWSHKNSMVYFSVKNRRYYQNNFKKYNQISKFEYYQMADVVMTLQFIAIENKLLLFHIR